MFQSAPPAKGAIIVLGDSGFVFVVSIRAPREGGDSTRGGVPRSIPLFQSAPPAKGAMALDGKLSLVVIVSIRAPREGGDIPETPLFC